MSTITIKEVKSFVTRTMKTEINKVLSGEVDSVQLFGVRPAQVEKHLESKGIDTEHEMDTNGWQWDFWFTYNDGDESYELAGDGYYNQSLTFKKN